jgi:rubrerythrin
MIDKRFRAEWRKRYAHDDIVLDLLDSLDQVEDELAFQEQANLQLAGISDNRQEMVDLLESTNKTLYEELQKAGKAFDYANAQHDLLRASGHCPCCGQSVPLSGAPSGLNN